MQAVLLLGCAAVVVAAVCGWIIRRWLPRQASRLGVGAGIAARLLAGVAVAWSVGRIVHRHPNAFGLVAAVFISVIGLWLVAVAVGMLYLAVFRRDTTARDG